jgi:MFS family permease
MMMVKSAWTIRPFRLFWGAGALSRLGAEIGEIALPALTLITLGATALEASWVRTATVVPFLLFTLWFGVIVDRGRRRPLMIAADLVRGFILVAVCVLALFGLLSIPILILAAVVVGTMTVLYQLADFSFLPQLVPEDRLIDANAKITATDSAIQTAGVGAGGILVQVLTAPIAIVVNALGYFASALLIGRLRVSEPRIASTTKRSAVAEAKAGLRVLVRHPILRALASEASIWNFGNEIFMLALAVHVLAGMPAGPLILGGIVTCGSVGAFLGSMFSARMTARFGYGRSLLTSLVLGNTAPLIGVLVAVFAPAAIIPSLCIAFFISGVGIGVANSQATSIRQIAVVPELRGRVNAGYRLASWGALSIGAILGGLLIGILGTMLAATAGAVLMALATLPVALSVVRRVRSIEEVLPEEVEPRKS